MGRTNASDESSNFFPLLEIYESAYTLPRLNSAYRAQENLIPRVTKLYFFFFFAFDFFLHRYSRRNYASNVRANARNVNSFVVDTIRNYVSRISKKGAFKKKFVFVFYVA